MKAFVCFVVFFSGFVNSAKADFFKIEDLPSHFKALAKNLASGVVRYQVYGDGACSGTLISDEGYVLTAQHCFEKCLRTNGAYEVQSLKENSRLYVAKTKRQFNKSCTFMYLETSSTDPEGDLSSAEAEIIAVGSGRPLLNPDDVTIDSFLDFYTLAGKALYQKLVETDSAAIASDYLIFKTDAFTNKRCAPTSHSEISPNHRQLVSLAYPTYTFRKKSLNPNGRSLYASYGEISSDGIFSSTSETLTANRKLFPDEALHDVYNNSDILWSIIDAIPGVSGSPAFTEDGLVSAMTVYSVCPFSRNQEFCRGSAASLKIASLSRKLAHRYGNLETKSWFSCRR